MPAAPLAPRSGPRLSPGRLLTEAQHRPDALAPVPQPQGRQVPTDHLHLAVQLHLAVAPATSCHLSALKLPLSRRAAPRRRRGPRARGCSGICLPARGADVSGFFVQRLHESCGDGRRPLSLAGSSPHCGCGPRRADTDHLRTRRASPETGDRRGRHVLSRERHVLSRERALTAAALIVWGRVLVSAVDR